MTLFSYICGLATVALPCQVWSPYPIQTPDQSKHLPDAQNANGHLTQNNNAGLMEEVNELKRKVADLESTIKRMRTDVDGSHVLQVNSGSSEGAPGRHAPSSDSSGDMDEVVIHWTF